MSDNERNQREYYRVNDEVAIHHRLIDASNTESESLEHAFDRRRQDFSLMSHLYYMRSKYTPQMRRIEQTSPSTAEYIKMLETQIDALCSRIVQQNEGLDENHTTLVNLSATGIRFPSKIEYPPNAMVELSIMLFPSRTTFLSFAKVIRSIPRSATSAQRGWDVAARFSHLHDEDQENLIKHVHQVQMDQLRKRSNLYGKD